MIDDVSGMVMLLSKISLRYVYVRLVFPAGKEVLHNNIILVKIGKNYPQRTSSESPAGVCFRRRQHREAAAYEDPGISCTPR